jgi:hypothetical protein
VVETTMELFEWLGKQGQPSPDLPGAGLFATPRVGLEPTTLRLTDCPCRLRPGALMEESAFPVRSVTLRCAQVGTNFGTKFRLS